MSEGGWLTKSEVNATYYNLVAGDILFTTEAQHGYQPTAVAKLIARQADVLGKRSIRVLELGANNCVFAHALLNELYGLCAAGEAGLDRIDYLAVEFARASLEAAADWVEQNGRVIRRGPPGALNLPPQQPAIVGLVTGEGDPRINLGLVHAEANQFVRSTSERFDFVILNELLDDMPCRAYFADPAGRCFELVSYARAEGGTWHVRVDPQPVDGPADLPPATVTVRSEECVELVTGIAGLLGPGGMLLVHDYGFAEPHVPLELYAALPSSLPAYVELELPPGSEQDFPRSFFRVFGNEERRLVQVTNDVNFAELAAALEPYGTVTTLAHGSSVVNKRGSLERGDGVFLSELALLEPGDDLTRLLARLHADQEELLARFIEQYMPGRPSLFLDQLFVRS